MRIFGAGLATETNTFSPVPTALDDFSVLRRADLLAGGMLNSGLDLSPTWGRMARVSGHDFVFGLNASAEPSGITLKVAYETLRGQLLSELQNAMPVDVVLLMLHGAMVAHGYEDCEEDLICRIRDVVGAQTVIAAEFDLHCHLSPLKLAKLDLAITFKEYPHVDVNERAAELFELAMRARRGEVRPTMALFDCRMVGLYPTTHQPMRRLVEVMKVAERRRGVLSVSFAHGFQFADVPNVGAKMLVVTDNDASLAQQVARELGSQVYALRREIGMESLSLPMDEALTKAASSANMPVVVADQSDNPGGGAPGDATFALRWVLDRGIHDVAFAIIYDPEVVRIAKKAGRQASLTVRLGGKTSAASGDPVDVHVTVVALIEDYSHALRQRAGEAVAYPAGDVVALRAGTVDIIVSSQRCQCFDPSIFIDLGIDPASKRLLVLKSTQHFYEAFAPMAGEVIYMAAPGALTPNPLAIPYRRLDTSRLYPWQADPLNC